MPVKWKLPAQPTQLIGRDAEIEGAARRLRRPEVRLLTLLGPGGVGKTRLAMAIVEGVGADYRDGVAFVDLARIREPSELLTAIAETLGLRDSPAGAATEQLQRYLEHRQMLLLLDNFEHLLNAASDVSNLLSASDRLTLLVTSREPLHLRWEHQFAVRPLALPPVNQELSPDDLGRVASVALFVERARAVEPTFQITPANAQPVNDICRRLDGLPLAIELAAARLAGLTPRALLARLEHRLELLTRGATDLPTRHQSLRAAIAASYDVLNAGEQRLFRRLGVFVGGASPSAIARVCTETGTTASEELDRLESLVAKNLLRVEDKDSREPRFSMLETIRDFAIECLAATGEFDGCVGRHTAYFLELAESADPEATPVVGPAVSAWLEPIEYELDNVRAVLHRTLEVQDGELSVRLAAALWPFWHVRSRFVEGTAWLQRALALSSAPSPTRAKALRGLGHLALRQNDSALAAHANEAALEIVTALGDELGVARSLHGLALVAMGAGDLARARSLLDQALGMHRRLGDTAWQALLLNFLGEVALAAGDRATAAEDFEASLALRYQLGDRWGIPQVLANLAALAVQGRDYKRAQTLYVDSLRRLGELGSKHGIADCLEGLAVVAGSTQRLHEAASLGSAAANLRAAIGVPLPASRKVDVARASEQVRLELGEAAWRAATQVGSQLPVEQAIELALGLIDQPGSARLPAATTSGPWREAAAEPLTVREREVTLLVAAGLTNPQIAERLVISRETAAVHVKHILSKLGFTSRTQIAAWVGGLRRP